jgi:hypothetical protein
MALSKNRQQQRQHRQQLKAQGLVHIRGWVTPQQAQAINAIMAGNTVSYAPDQVDRQPPAHNNHDKQAAAGKAEKKLHFKKKPDHDDGAWSVWLDNAELGTVYKHVVDGDPHPVTVWVAYRHGGRSTRHVSRQLAAEALLSEYRGFP